MINELQGLRFAVVITHNRPAELARLTEQLRGSIDVLVVVDNFSTPPVNPNDLAELCGAYVEYVRDDEQPPNLSRLWNVGFDACEKLAQSGWQDTWNVAMFNDDTSLPVGWYDAVVQALRSSSVAVACGAARPIYSPIVKFVRDSDIMHRMTPHAFIVKGELGLRGDESLRWWWGDTDFDWRARERGGMMIIPGYIADNTDANGYTNRKSELGEQAGRDRATFAAKWGGNPW